MQKRHQDRALYFKEQGFTTEKYVIPYLEEAGIVIDENTNVLEVGCGEGGNLVPFVQRNCKRVVGIDLSSSKIAKGLEFFKEIPDGTRVDLIDDNIYNIDVEKLGKFDLIVARDVVEHIHGQDEFMDFMKKCLKPSGVFFIAFPPWYNPFGGHQQVCKSKVLSCTPYFHILPRFMYKFILKLFGEKDNLVTTLLEIKDTGISIERFEKIIRKTSYKIEKRTHFFINPNYEIKFGLKPRVIWNLFTLIPFFRNFCITASYYLISFKSDKV